MNADRFLHRRGRAQWVIRREFTDDEGRITARWWNTDLGFGEPEDSTVFPTRLMAEAAHVVAFGPTQNWTAQRVGDAFAEVRQTHGRTRWSSTRSTLTSPTPSTSSGTP